MSTASLSSILRRGGALLVMGAALSMSAGCGGLGPGDYVFYRVSFSDQQKMSATCFGDAGIPANEKSDKTTFRKSSTFVLYGSAIDGEDKFYLDTGTFTLEGFDDGAILAFTATDTDIDFTDPNGTGDKITTTDKVEIEMTIDGPTVTGTAVETLKTVCSGSTCNLTLPSPTNCTTTGTFVGTEVDDVQLQHDI